MLQTITTNLSYESYKFIEEVVSSTNKTKRQVLEEALELYKQHYLEEQIKKGFKSRKKEYKKNVKDFESLQSKFLEG